MNAERRCRLIGAVDELRDVRQRLATVARRQAELDEAASAHRSAVRSDVNALLKEEDKILERLRAVLDEETYAKGDESLVTKLRWGMR